MTIHCLTSRSISGLRIGPAPLGHTVILRATRLSLAGLLVALAAAGCSPGPTGSFTATGSMSSARSDHTATLLSDGRVLLAGGTGSDGSGAWSPLKSAELYDPKTGTFSPTGSMSSFSWDRTATLLSDGRVLIAGGNSGSAELYDPSTGTFSPTGSMSSGRWGHTATLLSDGRVLIAGGLPDWSPLASAELYDPKTGAFSATASMNAARYGHTATLLSDGRVLIAGSDPGGDPDDNLAYSASADMCDPKTGAFSPTGSMTTARGGHTASLLSDGRVLIAGGDVKKSGLGYKSTTASAELYDPKTGTFSSAGSMSSGRYGHTASLLSDGRVLITGGVKDQSILASAEVYQP
jgi:hypothetical protein